MPAPPDWEAFYRRHFAAALGHARITLLRGTGVVDPDAAEDATQETFVNLMRTYPDLPNRSMPEQRRLLFTVVRNEAVRHVEKRRRWQPLTEEDAATLVGKDAGAESWAEASALLARLSPEDRLHIELKFFAGMSSQAIAKVLGTTENAINLRWMRLLPRLRDFFRDDDAQDHPEPAP